MASRIVANILCHNDLVYLQNLIPQVITFCDRVIVVDDCSTDGTDQFLSFFPTVERIERKFDLNFSNQRNVALQEVDNGDWVFRIDSDEVPSRRLAKEIREMVSYFDKNNVTRLTIPIFHLVNLYMCKVDMGVELRMFKKNESCLYVNQFHELIHGTFDGIQNQLEAQHSLIHFKYADPEKIAYTKDFFVKNGLYDRDDLKRRIDSEATFLPPFVDYDINQGLKNHLCTNPILKTKE